MEIFVISLGIVAGAWALTEFRCKVPAQHYSYMDVNAFLDDFKQLKYDTRVMVMAETESAYDIVTAVMKSPFRVEDMRVNQLTDGSFRYDFILRYDGKKWL